MNLTSSISRAIYNTHANIFGRTAFYKINKILFNLSLRGLGFGNYETDRLSGEQGFLRSFCAQKDVFCVVDIGANIGRYSSMVKSIAPLSRVYALEPHPMTFFSLQKAAEQNGFSAFNVAAGDSGGLLELFDYADNDGSEHASLFFDVIGKIHKSPVTSHKVRVTTLDNFVAEHSIGSIDLLKIDTEGNELAVLRGGVNCLYSKKIHVIQFEFTHLNTVPRIFMRDFYELLIDFDFYRMLPHGLLPMGDYNPAEWEIFNYQNIIAVQR